MLKLRFARGARDRLETWHPAYFALVMATGIVALAARLHGVPLLPTALFWLNAGFLTVLVAVMVLRIVRYPRAVAADLAVSRDVDAAGARRRLRPRVCASR